MKALVKVARGKGNMELLDIPVPKPGPNDVLLKVWGSGICGTDIHIFRDEYKAYVPPLTVGHEFSAVVAEVGSEVKNIQVGDRVVADVTTTEGVMGNDVVNGCHAEYICMPDYTIHKLPDNVSLRDAVLMEPLVACQHGVLEKLKVRPGDFVVLIGTGPIGLMMYQVINLLSPGTVVITGRRGVDEARLQVARDLGCKNVWYDDENVVERVLEMTNGVGADIMLECSGSDEGINQLLDMSRIGGQINSFSVYDNEYVRANLSKLAWKCITVTSSWCWWGYEEEATRASGGAVSWQRALKILATGKMNLKPFITHELPLEDWQKGFEICEKKEGVKVVLRPDPDMKDE
ncbi:MAG: zinc-dependent alcohol dehydrogenase [Christensenellaceae bacterium]|jgi:L-iditol 2-dehydrogenase